ncbi:hypothetical protein PGTUg99_026293, partial [Puccinia graminis f. sp. tritici]
GRTGFLGFHFIFLIPLLDHEADLLIRLLNNDSRARIPSKTERLPIDPFRVLANRHTLLETRS